MTETRVATRYATSLLDLALEKNLLDKVSEDMKLVLETISSSPEFGRLLHSPIVKEDKKITVFNEIFKSHVNPLTISFIELVTKHKREVYLLEIAREYHRLYNNHRGVQRAIVTTAIGLDDKLRKEVMTLIKKQTSSEVELIEKVDKDLIGGFTIKLGDIQIDSSIVRSLKKLRREMGDNPYKTKI